VSLVECSEKKFRKDLDEVLKVVDGQNELDLEKLASLQPNMRFLRNFNQIWQSLNQNLIREYLKIWSIISDQLNQSA
jgi:Asp-tRNA(Asn)/Glu-tRNA(Gln) amidotransferase C subunit